MCTENYIALIPAKKSLNVSHHDALLCFVMAVGWPFKSKSRLEAENAALRHQLIVLRRKVPGRVRLTNTDRWFYIRLLSLKGGRGVHLRQCSSIRDC